MGACAPSLNIFVTEIGKILNENRGKIGENIFKNREKQILSTSLSSVLDTHLVLYCKVTYDVTTITIIINFIDQSKPC